jgi:ribosomal protein L21
MWSTSGFSITQELPRVGRQRLDVAALALGVDGVEGQRRLARAGQAGDHDQLVARQVEIDVLQVVGARTADADGVHGIKLGDALKGASVTAKVVGHGRADKVRIVKFRRRKHHRKQMGHRQHYTEIEITGIAGGDNK